MKLTLYAMCLASCILISGCESHSIGHFKTFQAEDLVLGADEMPLGWTRSPVIPLESDTWGFGDVEDDRVASFSQETSDTFIARISQYVLFFASNEKAKSWYEEHRQQNSEWSYPELTESGEPWIELLSYTSSAAEFQHFGCMLDSRIAPEDVEMRIRNCIYLALYDRVFLHIHVIYDQDETSIAFLDEFLRKVDKRVIEHLAQERAAP
jgi:hypothetical protein